MFTKNKKFLDVLLYTLIGYILLSFCYILYLNFSNEFVPPNNIPPTSGIKPYLDNWENEVAIPVRKLIINIVSFDILILLACFGIDIQRNKLVNKS